MEIYGKVFQVEKEETGTSASGTQWRRQNIIIETLAQFSKKVCLNVNPEKVTNVSEIKAGDMILASINVESRQYNERWITNINAWRIDINPSNAPAVTPQIDVIGTLTQIYDPVSGTSASGKAWKRQEYVIQTQEQYPRSICFIVWGDRINPQLLKIGETFTISVELESRQSANGGWFPSVQAWKGVKGAVAQVAPAANNAGYGMEVQAPTITAQPQVEAIKQEEVFKQNEEGDALPF